MSSYTKINSKQVKDINIKPETIKLLEENIEEKLYNIGLGNDFFGYAPQNTDKNKNKQVGLHQTEIKHFCTAKESVD